MDAKDIRSKWVVRLGLDGGRWVWLSWYSLAALFENITELATVPDTFFRVTFSEETLATFQRLLTCIEECHAAEQRLMMHECRMDAAPLARAFNELQARSASFAAELGRPDVLQGFRHAQLEFRRSFRELYLGVERRLELEAGLRAPFDDCPGHVDISLHWGW
ncbi:hypothetical protein HPC49_51090 [Pyxidicoccus fallax]|uniref:Uncharacterized protein n=1 Tax=Pyxidicoccus fallax TaxID=394095 RepID=A0A848M0M8_9BACT|nr:hypothetical protein [Pyxidicoccus fallax]NMO23401.1 hypothetical protein [Pyxidicoccus fallax]NPC86521.1 hypothetical protein [Pyxidicoccus fallax]